MAGFDFGAWLAALFAPPKPVSVSYYPAMPWKPLYAMTPAEVSIYYSKSSPNAVATLPPSSTTQRASNVSQQGLNFVAQREGWSSTAYLDPPGNKQGLYSIGYGHQITLGDGLSRSSVISSEKGMALLRSDLTSAVATVNSLVRVPLKQSQFDALVSFVYNIGGGNFRNSTLLSLLNQGRFPQAAQEFDRWVYAGGQLNAGLITRRSLEKQVFLA